VKRWAGRLLRIGLVVAIVLVSGILWFERSGDLCERLILEAQAAYARRQRPTHVDAPLPGSFGETAGPAMADLSKSGIKALPDTASAAINEIRIGRRRPTDLPDVLENELRLHLPAARKILLATHARDLNLPHSLQPLEAEFWSGNGGGFWPVTWASFLAELDVRRQAADPAVPLAEETVDECIDLLALGRDVSYAQGIMGALAACNLTDKAAPLCAQLLQRATPLQREKAVRQTLRIRDAWSPFDKTLAAESLWSEVGLASALAGPQQLAQLPPEAIALMNRHVTGLPSWYRPLAPYAWRTVARRGDRWQEAMRQPEETRTAAPTKINEEADGLMAPEAGTPHTTASRPDRTRAGRAGESNQITDAPRRWQEGGRTVWRGMLRVSATRHGRRPTASNQHAARFCQRC
jgi:hypothetical protein